MLCPGCGIQGFGQAHTACQNTSGMFSVKSCNMCCPGTMDAQNTTSASCSLTQVACNKLMALWQYNMPENTHKCVQSCTGFLVMLTTRHTDRATYSDFVIRSNRCGAEGNL
jgi:hypothetical protein